MLFDERDLRVFDNPDSRQYFEEILQCYYSKNYRATMFCYIHLLFMICL